MSRSLLVTELRKSKRTALTLSRGRSSDSEATSAIVAYLNTSLEALGESTADHIDVSQSVPSGDLVGTAPAGPRFGRTPPNIYGKAAAAQVAATEKKSAAPADKVAASTEPDTEQTNEEDAKLSAAEDSEMITETDHSKETLELIVNSTNEANLERLGSIEAVQELTETLGGEPAPNKTHKQQASILKATARKAIKALK